MDTDFSVTIYQSSSKGKSATEMQKTVMLDPLDFLSNDFAITIENLHQNLINTAT